jgi:hypothetical protein
MAVNKAALDTNRFRESPARREAPMSWQLITLTPEASTLAVLGFGGFGFAAFSVAARLGRKAGGAWWEAKLQGRAA